MRTDGTTATGDGTFASTLDSGDTGNIRDRFVEEVQTLASHAQELMQATTTISTDSVTAAREQLRQSLSVAGESIKKFQAEALQRGRKAVEQTDTYVHENPWQAIAIGMVAGLALGLASGSLAARGMSSRA